MSTEDVTAQNVQRAIAVLEGMDPVKAPPFHAEAVLIDKLKDHLLAVGEYPPNFCTEVIREIVGAVRISQIENHVRASVLAQLQKLNSTNPTV